MRPNTQRRLGRGAAVIALLPLAASRAQEWSVRVIDDPGAVAACADPSGFSGAVADVNRMPQAEVSIDVSDDGRVAAAAKDFRYSPPTSVVYNDGVWNGLYLSADRGLSWRNQLFEDSDPIRGLPTQTLGDLGQTPGVAVTFNLESDPVVAFDGEGNLYTSGLLVGPGAGGPSAIVLTRRDRDGRIASGPRFFGTESDDRLTNDKNWLAVDRSSPADRAIVVQSWRLFTSGTSPPAPPGGYVAVSADGGRSFSTSLRLPVTATDAANSQFYQPLIGRDPNGRQTLYVFFTVTLQGRSVEMHLLRADLEGTSGDTPALGARLSSADAWTSLPRRLQGLVPYARDGWGGDFRVATYFHPTLDPDTGDLWVSFHAQPRTNEPPRAFVSRSVDAGATWSTPIAVDGAGSGPRLLPAIGARGGLASLVWYDSRNDPTWVPGGPIAGIDVYYAEVGADLSTRRVLRLTPETQPTPPLFTRVRSAGAASRGELRPHDFDPDDLPTRAASEADCPAERYGFLGDYIGLAVDRDTAYAAWGDMRDRSDATDLCAGHTCRGNRNANVWFAQIPR